MFNRKEKEILNLEERLSAADRQAKDALARQGAAERETARLRPLLRFCEYAYSVSGNTYNGEPKYMFTIYNMTLDYEVQVFPGTQYGHTTPKSARKAAKRYIDGLKGVKEPTEWTGYP